MSVGPSCFQGIVRAIRDYQVPLKEHEVTIFVRRGGPNYQEGLRVMGEVGKTGGTFSLPPWVSWKRVGPQTLAHATPFLDGQLASASTLSAPAVRAPALNFAKHCCSAA